jgi:hypothetical protein
MAEISIGLTGKIGDVNALAWVMFEQVLRNDTETETPGDATIRLKTQVPLTDGTVEIELKPGEKFSAQRFADWLCDIWNSKGKPQVSVKVGEGYYDFEGAALAKATDEQIRKDNLKVDQVLREFDGGTPVRDLP